MGKYVINIDEETDRGKEAKQLLVGLKNKKGISMMTLAAYEILEDVIIAREMKSAEKDDGMTVAEAHKEFSRIRKKMKNDRTSK